jgi:hypothetical protein
MLPHQNGYDVNQMCAAASPYVVMKVFPAFGKALVQRAGSTGSSGVLESLLTRIGLPPDASPVVNAHMRPRAVVELSHDACNLLGRLVCSSEWT